MNHLQNVLVWMDLEMTGLYPESCHIVQLAMIITDRNLTQITEPVEIDIWQPESVLDTMIPFVRNMHEKSGLLERIRKSKISVEEAEKDVMGTIAQFAGYKTARLCGNSISQDRLFIAKYMPTLHGYLHYRQVDVSTVKELAMWWHGVKYEKPDDGKHTALHDIQQSIAELKYFREKVFKKN